MPLGRRLPSAAGPESSCTSATTSRSWRAFPTPVSSLSTSIRPWWNTIVSPTGKEKTGYPTQKPRAILERTVRVHSRPGDRRLDFFTGSLTLGQAAARHGRSAVLIDSNPQALAVMRERLAFALAQEVSSVDRSPLVSDPGARRGRSTRKRAPPSAESLTSIVPPCSSTAMRVRARPRP
ncbi:MAG: hypothetical protein IPJ19_00390 [Planctomycetes bacterium]|nr:hypothetical protein [Planctomycetota bacterium]